MEQKTKINAEQGKQELTITREFEFATRVAFSSLHGPGNRRAVDGYKSAKT